MVWNFSYVFFRCWHSYMLGVRCRLFAYGPASASAISCHFLPFLKYSYLPQPPLLSVIKSRRLTFFGHLAWMDEYADASQAIFEPPPENWMRPPGRPRTTWMKNIHDDLSLLGLGIHKARDLVQNRPQWRLMSLHSATHFWTGWSQH